MSWVICVEKILRWKKSTLAGSCRIWFIAVFFLDERWVNCRGMCLTLCVQQLLQVLLGVCSGFDGSHGGVGSRNARHRCDPLVACSGSFVAGIQAYRPQTCSRALLRKFSYVWWVTSRVPVQIDTHHRISIVLMYGLLNSALHLIKHDARMQQARAIKLWKR